MVGFSRKEVLQLVVRNLCKNTNGERPTGYWRYKQVPVPVRQKVSKAHAVPQGLCENLFNALKLLASQQKDGGSPIQSIVAEKELWRA